MSKRIIKISNNKFYYTIDNFVTLSQTNFPMNDISFKSEGPHSNFYWEVEIISYDKTTKFLRIKVINYTSDDIAQFNEQEAKETLNKLIFEELEWDKLEPCLSSYKRNSLWPLISEKSKSDYNESMISINDSIAVLSNEIKIECSQIVNNGQSINNLYGLDDSPPTNRIRTYKEEIRIPIKDAVFSNGYVSILCKFAFYSSKIELKVFNSNIIPEYNHIKNFFHKLLKKKTFIINAEIEIDQDDKITTKADSPEIDAINEDFIKKINQKQIQKAIKSDYSPELNKCLFTADEFLSKDNAGNIFKQDAQDIIKVVLNMEDVRNKRQLEYLSGYNITEKILLTLKPNFGFLFLIKDSKKHHFCWELLNSHATYLWSIKSTNNFEELLNRIEEEISIIQKNGRNDYKINAKRCEFEGSFEFNVINHIKIETEIEDSFNNWKRDLLKLLI